MSFVLNVNELRERAQKRVATQLPLRPCYPESGSKVAAVAPHARVLRTSANPLMTAAQGDDCHSPCWTEAEMGTFAERSNRAMRLGLSPLDAEYIAERLTLRDRDTDDRMLCVECARATPGPRCAARQAFLADQLKRCPLFKLASISSN